MDSRRDGQLPSFGLLDSVNRPFAVTDRSDTKGIGSRLDTLFYRFGITARHFDELKNGFEADGEARDELLSVDYSGVQEVLEAERKKAEEFYKKSLNIKEPNK